MNKLTKEYKRKELNNIEKSILKKVIIMTIKQYYMNLKTKRYKT